MVRLRTGHNSDNVWRKVTRKYQKDGDFHFKKTSLSQVSNLAAKHSSRLTPTEV